MPDLAISRIHYPVTSLGFGRRVGIWVQGCSIGCRNCISQDTWERGEERWTVASVVESVLALVGEDEIDGITLTGGEPTEQWSPLTEVLSELREVWGATDLDVLLFTGLTPPTLRTELPSLGDDVDVAVAGPYIEQQASASPLRASENQELLLFTEIGRRRYSDLTKYRRQDLQLVVDSDGVSLIGLPAPGEMDSLTARLEQEGIQLSGRSWDPE